jgi:phosphoenolpyruvate carboxykinase (ATP)
MPRPAGVYAKLLGERIQKHKARCWLINTGWTGGGYGVGRRMPLRATRALLHAALDGRLEKVELREHPLFKLRMPTQAPEVDASLLDPERAWGDKEGYRSTAREVAQRFEKNFEKFAPQVDRSVVAAGIHAPG